MKFKVRGLVFVGFAAAILSANAALADPDNTVTSKSYVDNKFQIKSTAASIGNSSGSWTPVDQTVSDEGTSVPTTAAVKDYVDTAVANTGATVQNGTLTVNQNGNLVGSFTANQATNFPVTLNIAAPNWTAASGTAGYIDNKPTALSQFTNDLGDQKTANLSSSITTDSGSTTMYPSVAAVEAYVGTQAAASNFVEDQIVDGVTAKAPSQNVVYDELALKQNANTAVTHAQNTAVGSTTVPVYIDSTGAAQPTSLGTAATANVSTTGVGDGETNLVTGDQVYEYVDGLPAADIPAMPTQAEDADGYCDASHPCALVTDDSTGAPVWKRIAQAGDQ